MSQNEHYEYFAKFVVVVAVAVVALFSCGILFSIRFFFVFVAVVVAVVVGESKQFLQYYTNRAVNFWTHINVIYHYAVL